MNPQIIRSQRLDLILLDPQALQHSLTDDLDVLQNALLVRVPADWFEEKQLVELRAQQIQCQPEYQPWSLRAITTREAQQMVGHIGFHTPPGASYLQSLAPNGVEFGYSIFPTYRRNGYAREAALAVMQWAFQQHAVSEFVLSISPDNLPSLKLAQRLGFQKIGSHVDEEDGVEDIYRLDYHRIQPA